MELIIRSSSRLLSALNAFFFMFAQISFVVREMRQGASPCGIRLLYAIFFRLTSHPTQDSTATAPDTIITILQQGGITFCTCLPAPRAALPSRPFTAPATVPAAAAAGTVAGAVKGLLGRAARGAGKQVQKVIPPCCKIVMIVSGAVAVLSCVGWLVSRKKIA